MGSAAQEPLDATIQIILRANANGSVNIVLPSLEIRNLGRHGTGVALRNCDIVIRSEAKEKSGTSSFNGIAGQGGSKMSAVNRKVKVKI